MPSVRLMAATSSLNVGDSLCACSIASAIFGLLAIAYGGQSLPVKARRIVEELEMRSTTETIPPAALFTAYLGAGATNKAVDALERVVESRDNYAIYIGVDPLLDPLRGNARFERLRSRVAADATGLSAASVK